MNSPQPSTRRRRPRGLPPRVGAPSRGRTPAPGRWSQWRRHGRADHLVGTDTSATVGWFTSVFPVRLGGLEIDRAAADPTAAAAFVAAVEATLTDVPTEGVGFGLLTAECPELAAAPAPQVVFNYLGRGDLIGATTGDWSFAGEYALRDRIPRISGPGPAAAARAVGHRRSDGHGGRPRLLAEWRWHSGVFGEADLDRLTDAVGTRNRGAGCDAVTTRTPRYSAAARR